MTEYNSCLLEIDKACDDMLNNIKQIKKTIKPPLSTDSLDLLDLKNRLHIDYMLGVCAVSVRQLSGKSLTAPKGKQLLDMLITSRVYIDKMRSIEHRAKPIINDILSSDTKINNSDCKPNLKELYSNEEDDEIKGDLKEKSKKYKPMKIVPLYFPQEEEKEKNERIEGLTREVIEDWKLQYTDNPLEIFDDDDNDGEKKSNMKKKKRKIKKTKK